MLIDWSQVINQGKIGEENKEKLEAIAAGTPRWAIVNSGGFTKKLVHVPPPVEGPKYSEELREFFEQKLGYSPSDNAIDLILSAPK